mgnify:CR=1 FL=1
MKPEIIEFMNEQKEGFKRNSAHYLKKGIFKAKNDQKEEQKAGENEKTQSN